MVEKREKEREILPHITLKTHDDTKLKKKRMAIGGYSHRPIGADDFKNMLSKAVSVGNVKSDGFDNSYFLMELGSEYYSSGVSSMLKDLDIQIKTVLTETQIIVKAIPIKIEEYFRKKQTIPKKITEPIKNIYVLDSEHKIAENLLRLIKKDIDKRKTFGISIQLIDNLDYDEENNFQEIMKQELSRDINPQYLENSRQYICGTSAKRIIEISKKPFIKRISEQGKAKPQLKIKMTSLKDKGKYFNLNDFYMYLDEDVKEAVLEFEDFIYNSNHVNIEEFKLEIYEKMRDIFGDWEDE